MTSPAPHFSGVEILTYSDRKNDHPVRVFTFEEGGAPYFCLDDLCRILGWTAAAAARVEDATFPEHGRRTVENPAEEGTRFLTVLSPVGVYLWTDRVNAGRAQKITAWARRESKRLCPSPRPDDPAMVLKLLEGDVLPPRPLKFSGWSGEWTDLKFARLYAVISGDGWEALRPGGLA